MARIALIDDDPTEALIVQGMLDYSGTNHTLAHYRSVEDFAGSEASSTFDLVMLDRRIPPHQSFPSSLAVLKACAFTGPILLLSAGAVDLSELSQAPQAMRLAGPLNKADLLTPESMAAAIAAAMAP